MAILPVVKNPDPLLRTVSVPVEKIDDDLRDFMKMMLDTMHAEKGMGIAAVQVGKPIRALIVEIPKGHPFFIINPIVESLSSEKINLSEGCLSVREKDGEGFVNGEVSRPIGISITYTDLNGNNQKLAIDGNKSEVHKWFARCLQHELDHLDGKLFIDYNPSFIPQEEL